MTRQQLGTRQLFPTPHTGAACAPPLPASCVRVCLARVAICPIRELEDVSAAVSKAEQQPGLSGKPWSAVQTHAWSERAWWSGLQPNEGYAQGTHRPSHVARCG